MSISTDCMVVNLRVSLWHGQRLDREASEKVTKAALAHEDAARVNKHLVSKSVIKCVTQARDAARRHFYDRTLPWKDNGDRLLTRKMYMQFMEEHGAYLDGFKEAVETFLTVDYPKAREQAGFRMGELFNPDDYPSVSTLRHKFSMTLDIDAVTEAGDFRVEIDDEAAEKIRENMTQEIGDRMQRTMLSVWERMADAVGFFAGQMNDTDRSIYQSAITKLEDVVELLPALNLMDDPQLEKIRQDISGSLVGYDVKTLRKDSVQRAEAGEEANRIMQNMKGFMDAMKAAA